MENSDKNIFNDDFIEREEEARKFRDLVLKTRMEKEEQHAKGIPALQRLLPIAQGHSGQCRIVANFLLSLYNGNRFKFDLTDFRSLDIAIFIDCIAVLWMDYRPKQEVHSYFKNGDKIWEDLAKKWHINNN